MVSDKTRIHGEQKKSRLKYDYFKIKFWKNIQNIIISIFLILKSKIQSIKISWLFGIFLSFLIEARI